MFNIDEAIKQWRRSTQNSGRLEDGDIEELESHLRDLIAQNVAEGVTPADAFKRAVDTIGAADSLGAQYRLARERQSVQTARKFLPGLLVNYIIVMLRQFRRHSLHSAITVIGLAVGLASCLFIAVYVLHETSFDKQYAARNIYRVSNHSLSDQGVEEVDAGGPPPMGPALKEEFPEVINAVRFWRAYRPTITYSDVRFEEQDFVFADHNAISVFGFPLVSGNAEQVLMQPNSVVISQQMATKYFGNADPVGKTIEYDGYPQGKLSFVVTGVFKDLPANTHFSFDFLASLQTVTNEINFWGSFKPIWTYVELNDAQAAVNLQRKLDQFVSLHMADRKKYLREFGLRLEPIGTIYLESNAGRPMKPGGNPAMIRVAIFTGVLILVMSCVNFVNISFARVTVRMKEVGMRKVLGAVRRQLAFQFIAEVIATFVISLVLAGALMFLLTPSFASITGVYPTMGHLLRWEFGAVVLGIFVFVVLLSGYIPATRMAGYSVVSAFRQKTAMSSSNGVFTFRNVLIFVQLAISGMLIMAVMVVHEQLNYIANKDLGVSVDRVIAIPYSINPEAFENKLRTIPGVESFGYSQRLPVNTLNYDGRIVTVPGIEGEISVESCFITPGFLDTYNIKLVAGRNLFPNHLADSNKFIINTTAVKTFGWSIDEAVGRELTWSRDIKGEVVGVVEDFHLESVHATIPPMVMPNGERLSLRFYRTFLSIRLNAVDAPSAEKMIEQEWRTFNPERVFMIVRMDESFNRLHASDQLFSKVVLYFMVIAIFISAIGLYALSSYAAEQKRKEIGIRKVLGSNTAGIIFKLAAPYIYVALSAFIVVLPIVYLAMTKWLSTFAYHIPVSWFTLVAGGALVLMLTFISVLRESVRAAVLNPIRFLREE